MDKALCLEHDLTNLPHTGSNPVLTTKLIKPKTKMSKKEEKRIWKKVKELRKKGLLPLPTEEDIKDEPTALANSQYRLENKQNK